MATAVESLRTGSGANSTALHRWAQELSRVADGESVGVSLVDLFRQTGIPLGSAFGQWAMLASIRADSRFSPGGNALSDLLHQLDQKVPAGDLPWIEDVSQALDGAPID